MIVLTYVTKSTATERGRVSLAGVFSDVVGVERAINSISPDDPFSKITGELQWFCPDQPDVYYEGYEAQLDVREPYYQTMVVMGYAGGR